jgi:hypothetical protein
MLDKLCSLCYNDFEVNIKPVSRNIGYKSQLIKKGEKMKDLRTKLAATVTALAMLFCMAGTLYIGNSVKISAETFGDFEYEISDGGVTITDYTGDGGDVVIPGEIDGLPVTGIGDDAFYNCISLTSILIPDSVTSIGNWSFAYCGLTNVRISDSVTSIGDSAFSYCTSLSSIEIPNSVTSIGDSVFFYCTSLTSIEIPDSVTSIEKYAFYNCERLTSITIPDSVTRIGDSAISYCTSLASIEIPDSVTSIGGGAFSNCTNLTSIEIPDSVTSIGSSAFYNTAWLDSQPDGLVYAGKVAYEYKGEMPENTEIVIRDGTVGIAGDAFAYCHNLINIEIPDSVTNIGDFSFSYSVKSIYVSENNPVYSSLDGTLFNKTQTVLICYPAAKEGEYVIPDSVTSILSHAFYGCMSLTSIEIPDSVTSIGDGAFRECITLTSIEIPDSVTSIGDSAFEDCTSLESVEIPDSVTSVGEWAFGLCENLTSIEIPDSVTIIDEGEFFGCTNLTSVEIPDSVTSIGVEAFAYCTSLTSIEIPDGVTSIGDEAFFGCTSLTSVEIPDSVTSIGDSAFENCTSLTSVTIPDSVDNIKQSAFGYIYVSFNFEDVKIDNFTIHGYSGTAAETYATENGFEFVSLGDKPQVIPGDVNEDGEVTVADVVALANFLLDESSEINAEAADVYKDGKIDAKDLMYIVLKLSGKIKEFPAAA